ncbi:hypothetical protein G6L63_01150 [Agrobacterium vitis]|uniref:Uncharacterized protein n=1 Tax=Agrobacterium vitis TaxID=373 RepID=A0A368NXN5_AGRVI|nr:hypothetical protein [Agrobacterium vitis]KAA3514809.1 hypothetical protein DXM22_13530 [Agrobacterium vitis]KAA3528395.1 hypothetical protein DXT89_10285 [Agrobacterium vitis]MCF1477847.1 hypothetical protein [Agrobacterium vitis]MUZ98090.1 hypothetical protein [Agrobacterium vitis]MVA31008.1 hypothetical protein [Agrobacterium vitis]
MQPQYILTTFTPAEAEKITTLSTVAQRDWRRREFLPTVDGHARFDAFALAEIWVMKMLSDRGVGPQASKEVANWCAIGILWHALKNVDAYEGDHHKTFDWYPEKHRPKNDPEEAANFRQLCEDAGWNIPENVDFDFTWHSKSQWLTKQIFRLRGYPKIIPARYFIWWADGSHLWHDNLAEAFSSHSSEARYAGPVIVLDLEALATTLSQRAGRALVHVEFPVDGEGNLVSPIEYGAPVPLT